MVIVDHAKGSCMAATLRGLPVALLVAAAPLLAAGPGGEPATARRWPTEWFRVVLPAIQQTPGQSPRWRHARWPTWLGLHEAIVAGILQERSLAGQLVELESLPPAQPDDTLHWPTVPTPRWPALTSMLPPNAPADWKGASRRWSAACRCCSRRISTRGARRR